MAHTRTDKVTTYVAHTMTHTRTHRHCAHNNNPTHRMILIGILLAMTATLDATVIRGRPSKTGQDATSRNTPAESKPGLGKMVGEQPQQWGSNTTPFFENEKENELYGREK